MKQSSDFKDLTGLLLGPIRERPGMFLGQDKISKLVSFITGYALCLDLNGIKDKYFGHFSEPGFSEWLLRKKNVAFASTWDWPLLEEANHDEQQALQLFFIYLEEFSKQHS
jgi:hypothetical protein